jgi:four helix bundle protein
VADFKKLKVWQKSHALSLSVDRVCKQIRTVHYASLRSQMFRAAMSIPANIAEGRRQTSEKQFSRFLGYALNSASELEHHLIVARDTQNIPENRFRPVDQPDHHSAENALRSSPSPFNRGARFAPEENHTKKPERTKWPARIS